MQPSRYLSAPMCPCSMRAVLCGLLALATAWGGLAVTRAEAAAGDSKAVFLAVQHQRKPLDTTTGSSYSNSRGLIGVQVPSTPVQLGQYYITLMIGQPPQRINAVIDTGSGIVHAACTGCKTPGCHQVTTPFKPSLSTTLQHVSCASPECTLVCTKAAKHQPLCSDLQACATSACQCGQKQRCEYEVDYADGSTSTGALLADDMYLAAATDVAAAPTNQLQRTSVTPPVAAVGLSYVRSSGHAKNTGHQKPARSTQHTSVQLVFGCDDKASLNTYDPAVPMYAGLSFQAGSLFSQLVDGGLASEPILAFCLGDGTPAPSASGQNRRKLQGSVQTERRARGIAVSEGSPGVVVVGAAHPHNLKMLAGVAKLLQPSSWVRPDELSPPGLWLHLTSVTMNDAPTDYTQGTPPLSVLLDTGTTGTMLPNNVWYGLLPDLKKALKAVSATSFIQVDNSQGFVRVHTHKDLTVEELDQLYPTLIFGFASASNTSCLPYAANATASGSSSSAGSSYSGKQNGNKEVRIPLKPSKYMLVNIPGYYRDWVIFLGDVGPGGDNTGILGNAFMNGMFVQADVRCAGVALGLVDSCDQVTFT